MKTNQEILDYISAIISMFEQRNVNLWEIVEKETYRNEHIYNLAKKSIYVNDKQISLLKNILNFVNEKEDK